jgi:DNA polymerase eta
VRTCSCLKVKKGTTTEAAEKASIDEAYMDLSAMVRDRLLAAHPFLAQIPVDAPEGIDSLLPQAPHIDWTDAGHVLPTLAEYMESNNEPDDEEEALQRIGVSTTCWSDWALRIGAEIMMDVRQAIWKRLHYTSSAGIAHNKAMAKVRSQFTLCILSLCMAPTD